MRAGGEGFVIDSPVYPDEVEALPDVLEQADFPVDGLLTTHADWDHLLARLAFPSAALGCAESTAQRLTAEPWAAQRSLRNFDQEHYVLARPPLSLGSVQALPVPGRLALDEQRELELHPAEGHTADGVAFLLPWLDTLVCGDYLSPLEIPMISEGGSIEAYLDTLGRLRPLVERCATVVPGHGAPYPRDQALQVLAEDIEYLKALSADGARARLPAERRSSTQKRIHEENATREHPGRRARALPKRVEL